jgi:hypothetical protein
MLDGLKILSAWTSFQTERQGQSSVTGASGNLSLFKRLKNPLHLKTGADQSPGLIKSYQTTVKKLLGSTNF